MKRLTFISVLLSTSLVYAAAETTQTLLPKGGQQEFKAGLTFNSGKDSGNDGTSDFEDKQSGYVIPFSYFYGLTDGNAIGLESSYGDAKFDQTSVPGGDSTLKASGLGDLVLRYKGLIDLGSPSLYVSAGYSFGLDKQKFEATSSSEQKVNRYSSQPAAVLQAGLVQPLTGFNLGALASYSIHLEGKRETKSTTGTTTEATVTGGNEMALQVFGELEDYFHPNLALVYDRSYTKEYKTASSTSSFAGNDFWNLVISGRMEMMPGIEFLPSFTYQTMANKTVGETKYDKYENYDVTAMFRFLF